MASVNTCSGDEQRLALTLRVVTESRLLTPALVLHAALLRGYHHACRLLGGGRCEKTPATPDASCMEEKNILEHSRHLYWHVLPHVPEEVQLSVKQINHQLFAGDSLLAYSAGHHTFGTGADTWEVYRLDDAAYAQLQQQIEATKKAASLPSNDADGTLRWSELDALVVFADDGASLVIPQMGNMKPLHLDFTQVAYRQRLLRGGRVKEPVARAVLHGVKVREPLEQVRVFDATAGLGRESMILAHAGAQVVSFERQVPIWMILADALNRAQRSRFFPFKLPKLLSPGDIRYAQIKDAIDPPDVIYYDPMFPERGSSAQVKKEMAIFQRLVGEDSDTLEFLKIAVNYAVQRVVVKRPKEAPPLQLEGIERSHFIDAGVCRFDCYVGRTPDTAVGV